MKGINPMSALETHGVYPYHMIKINSLVQVNNRSGLSSRDNGCVGVVNALGSDASYVMIEFDKQTTRRVLVRDLDLLDVALTPEIWRSTENIKNMSDRLLRCGKIIENLRLLSVVLATSLTLRNQGEFKFMMTDLLQHGFGDTLAVETT